MPVRMIVAAARATAADARDQRDVGDQAVHRAEDARPQPAAGDVRVMVSDVVMRLLGHDARVTRLAAHDPPRTDTDRWPTHRCGSSPTSSARTSTANRREVVLVESRGCAAPQAVPPAEAAPRPVRDAPPRRGAGRPRPLPAHRHLPGGAGAGRTSGARARADLARRGRPRRAPAQGGARRGDPADADVRPVPQGVRRVGGRSQHLPDGGLLPGPAACASTC